MHHPTDRIAHTMTFGTPVVDHWLEREIATWNKKKLNGIIMNGCNMLFEIKIQCIFLSKQKRFLKKCSLIRQHNIQIFYKIIFKYRTRQIKTTEKVTYPK